MKNKKAMSVIIGYVLLIVFAAVLGVIVYNWQKTFTPQDEYAACPEGASLLVYNVDYDCDNNRISFEVKNTGQFAIGGYFIYVKDNPAKQIATIDLSKNNTDALNPMLYPLRINGIKLGLTVAEPELDEKNDFVPGQTEIETYTLEGVPEPIYTLEIVPIRWQKDGLKTVIGSCKEVRVVEEIAGCEEECVSVDPCGDRECGTMLDNCYDEVPCGAGCGDGWFCDSTGHCVEPVECTLNCDSLGYVCGYHIICGAETYCGDATPTDDGCPDGYTCDDFSGHCILDDFSCNGIWEGSAESPGIECDGPESGDPYCNEYCYCEPGYEGNEYGICIDDGGGVGEIDCTPYCISLGLGYTSSACLGNSGQCTSSDGDYRSGGNPDCVGALQGTYCCCYPNV